MKNVIRCSELQHMMQVSTFYLGLFVPILRVNSIRVLYKNIKIIVKTFVKIDLNLCKLEILMSLQKEY